MNLKEIKEIISLMNDNELSEIEIEREGTKIKIRKSSAEAAPATIHRPFAHHVETPAGAKPPEKEAPAGNTKNITSPMVGTFYRAPSPEAPPFIDVGDVVEVGQVVCIVEAMKLMNEIKSEIRGKIVQIPMGNAEPVEFGQVLFAVEPF